MPAVDLALQDGLEDLARLDAVGERRATALALTGQILDANEALRLGLVDEVLDASQLSDRAAELSTQLANGSAQAVEWGLKFIQQARGHDPSRVLSLAREYRLKAHSSPDFQEGIAAFLAKRKPVWPSTSS